MKKVFQPNVRKVYGATPQESQMNAVRKIHNLLSSGAVTVTGPTQPRILKQKFVGNSMGGIVQHQQNITNIGNNQQQQQQQQQINMHQSSTTSIINSDPKCYVCDEPAGQNYTLLNEATTSNTQTKLPNKIGQIVGDSFMVIISCEDVLCKRCTTMINHYDRLETDIERVKTNILNYLYKKYGLSTDDDDRRTQLNNNNVTTIIGSGSSSAVATTTLSPPIKMQKLNTGNIANRRIINNNNNIDDDNHTRKITIQNIQTNRDPIENQLSTLFESGNLDTKITTSHTSAVQQMKILSPQQHQQQQPPKRGPIKIYKCMSCEFKTTDLKQFQPHYETCKQQNNYCKLCKKQFTNSILYKQHMNEKHNQQQNEFSCPVCYIKFLNDITLKKHIEINHPDLKAVNEPTASQLFACNMCHYMTSDKPNYDEHMRKHVKVKPFKCRLCSTRFETREQASIHAKSHQPNYFKCGTCSASFTQRELLVKHFETHQNQQQQQQQLQQQQQQTVQQKPQQQQSLTTQKLLQETIDEALRESDHVETKGIHFFSCNICSLTFIQENYYKQHMETHKKAGNNSNVGVGKKTIAIVSTNSTGTVGGNGNDVGIVGQTSVGSTVSTVVSTAGTVITTSSQSLIRQEIRNTNILTTAPSSVGGVNSGIITSHSSNNSNSSSAVAATISEADIESIFEKMHSDKTDNDGTTIVTTAGTTTTTGTNESLVITSQENAVGGITFNITIPQPENSQDKKTTNEQQQQNDGKSSSTTTAATNDNISVGISMPVLDQPEESSSQHSAGGEQNKNNITESPDDDGSGHHHQQQQQQHHHQQNTITDHHQQDISQESTSNSSTVPVSMPSLDDDGEATGSNEHEQQQNMEQQQQQQHHQQHENDHQQDQEQHHHHHHHDEQQQQQHQVINSDHVSMELEDMQNSVEGGQIKFILNENGQILQLDNHIITTDADGNQILVEGTDSEQIQQLLQSVGVLQSGGSLVDGETLQMIQGENNQMIIVQQGEDGHQLIDASLLNADGHIVIQQAHHDDSVDMVQDGTTTHHQAHAIDEDGVRIPVSVAYTSDGQQIVQATTGEHQEHEHQQQQQHDDHNVQSSDTNENIGNVDESGNPTTTGSTTTTQSSLTQVTPTTGGGGNGSEEFFALDDLKI